MKDINERYQNRKKLSFSPSNSQSINLPAQNKSYDLNLDFGNIANTLDTRMNTFESMKAGTEVMKNFFSTYSGRIEEVLLTQRKKNMKKNNLQTQRVKNKTNFMLQDSPLMFKGDSELLSDREINENIMDIDDSLSDVPVRDCQNAYEELELSNNLSMEESEQLLDNLGLLSPLMKQFQQDKDNGFNSNSKGNTPSFKTG